MAELPQSPGDSNLYWKERTKYEKIWEFPKYRAHSPGEQLVKDAINIGMEPGQSVCDFGCGTGRAARLFIVAGFNVLGVDIADNCLDDDVSLIFMQACLWELPEFSVDWGFCTDVMEHIPPTKVEGVLTGIKLNTSRGVFFQIYTAPDHFGSKINDILHLTIEPKEWWEEKLSYYWPDVEILKFSKHRFTVVCHA